MSASSPLPFFFSRSRSRLGGFSILELMISLTIGLLITALLITVYSRTSSTHAEFKRANSQIESGRFALQVIQQDLVLAGFWGEYGPTGTPTAPISPCKAWSGSDPWTATDKTNVFLLPVQGYAAPSASAAPTPCGTPISNPATGSDVLVVRHAETCEAGTTGCEAVNNSKLYLQVSKCSSDTTGYVLDTDSAAFTLKQKDSSGKSCTTSGYTSTLAGKRKFVSNIYYVRDLGDGHPSLVRSAFDITGPGPQSAQVLVEDVEKLRVEYARDTSGDGIPDTAYENTCSACTTDAEWASFWSQVVAVRLYVLARSSGTSPGHTDTKTYNLGSGGAVGPFNDGYKRHVYTLVVRLVNVASRKY
jgi:type IV pilus assembly protein PilW